MNSPNPRERVLPPSFSCLLPRGWGAEEARAENIEECSMLGLLFSEPARTISELSRVCPVPRLARSFASACGLLAFLYGDGIIEVCLTSTGRKWVNVRVNTPRPATLFAGIGYIVPFLGPRSQGSVYCNKGICGTSMTFKATIDVHALESYGLPGILSVKPGIRKDILRCMEDEEAFYSTVAGLIDSEGHVRRSARIIEIGMKDKPLLKTIVAELNRRGIKATGPRDSKVPIIEIKINETARPIIEKMLNPEKRLMAMRTLVPDNLTRTTIYRKALHKLLRLIENKRKLPKQKCLACAKTVLREVKALASTGSTPAETRGGAKTPPHYSSQYSIPLLSEHVINLR